MDTSTVLLLVISIAAVVAVVLVLRSNLQASNSNTVAGAAKPRSPDKSKPISKGRYRATSIVCGENACAAALAIKGSYFLVEDKDTPQIPVPNCDVKKCSCRYAHHDDRRVDDDDRRGPRGLRSDLHSHVTGVDRRTRRGRRKSD